MVVSLPPKHPSSGSLPEVGPTPKLILGMSSRSYRFLGGTVKKISSADPTKKESYTQPEECRPLAGERFPFCNGLCYKAKVPHNSAFPSRHKQDPDLLPTFFSPHLIVRVQLVPPVSVGNVSR